MLSEYILHLECLFSLDSSGCNHFFLFPLFCPTYLQEEFLKDVMQFLILRGHTRLIPQGGLAEFPDAILNAKRLDLFNLYREVSILVFVLIKDISEICKGCRTIYFIPPCGKNDKTIIHCSNL